MEDYQLIIIIAAAIIVFIVYSIVKRNRELDKIRRKIANSWGKAPDRKYKHETIKHISGYFTNKMGNNEVEKYIDNITWSDLDMDEVFKKINSTNSRIGEEYLYSLLREPLYDKKLIKKRDNMITYFQKNKSKRELIQFHLELLGNDYKYNLSDIFYNRGEFDTKIGRYILQALMPLVSVGVMFLVPSLGILLLIISLIANGKTYAQHTYFMEAEMGVLEYLLSAVLTLNKIKQIDLPDFDTEFINKMEEVTRKFKSLGRKLTGVAVKIEDPFGISLILNMLFLIKIISYKRATKAIIENEKVLKEMYMIIGELDSLIAIASYREGLQYYCIPEFEDNPKSRSLNLVDVYHPLIKNPVVNSINEHNNLLITGSNASGKSTFLKTLAINAILAQTISTSLSKSHLTNIYYVLTSMALKDDIAMGESYFIVEIKSLKRIIDAINSEVSCLLFIDEVLRGTNTIERIAASSEILRQLGKQNCLCIAATHDIELANILKEDYYNYHFREKIEDDNVIFDYKLYEGATKSRNAIKLLKLLGYDNTLIINAEERAQTYIETGLW